MKYFYRCVVIDTDFTTEHNLLDPFKLILILSVSFHSICFIECRYAKSLIYDAHKYMNYVRTGTTRNIRYNKF
jgi:hypothetical protein